MAGKYHHIRVIWFKILAIGHDINYIALSGILSVGLACTLMKHV
jgi:hypothetical protein